MKAQAVKPSAAPKAAAPKAVAPKAVAPKAVAPKAKPVKAAAAPKPAVAPAAAQKAAKPAQAPAAPKPQAQAAKPVAKARVAPAAIPRAPAPVKPVAPKAAAPAVVKTAKPLPPPSALVAQEAAVRPAPGGIVRSPRPSSRLAQITVPSMAQSVASTAAKASYLQSMPTTMIAPPPPMAAKKDAKLANNWKTKSASELTDEELLAMPDSEYMNDKQMAFFRLKLVQLKQDMLNNAGETTEHLREDTVVVPDPADRATIEEEHALELRTRDRERKLLKKIEQSIQRIDSGDYGYCDETGEPIGVGRLLARPTATLSLEAQQRRELKQKMFGD